MKHIFDKIVRACRSSSPVAAKIETPLEWPDEPGLPKPVHDEEDLVAIDRSYAGMYALHKACHKGLIAELNQNIQGLSPAPSILEAACGSGWNTNDLDKAGFRYWGMDISENAISVAIRRYPHLRFINCDIRDISIIADNSFDYVFNASMLEHLSDYESALKSLIRNSKKHLYVLFYEGLILNEPDKCEHKPFDNPEWNKWFGKKLADYQHEHNGYFMRRFSRGTIESIVKSTSVRGYEILDRNNRNFAANESILHVWK